MRKALHPLKNEEINVPEYICDFGNSVNVDTERVRCPICKQRMYVVASSAPNSIGHFAHMPNAAFCPTKITSAAPYAALPPLHPDPEAARIIKRKFVQNWEKHFCQLDWLVKGLAYQEFIEVIKAANASRIWEYAKLEEFQLPYVFATLTDFPPEKSYTPKDKPPKRKCYFRCWFDASVQRYDDLWIHRNTPLQFWRAWYALPAGKRKPNAEDLIGAYPMNMDDDFLQRDCSPTPYVVKKVNSWLAKNFKVD